MKISTIASSFLLTSALMMTSLHAQQEADSPAGSIVIVGALTASMSVDSLEFSNLPSGRTVRIGSDGVQVLDTPTSVSPDVPRLSATGISGIPPMEKEALKRRLQQDIEMLFDAMNEGIVSEEDVMEIVKFFLGVDLPWDERFLELTDQNLGEGFAQTAVAEADFTPTDRLDETREDDPSFIGSTGVEPGIIQDPVQVTDPVDTTPYFAP